MNIGLDFDDTYTLDPEFWNDFIVKARDRGHRVYVVTCRRETFENRRECDVPMALTYFTSCAPKDWYMKEKGIVIDVWIDDHPDCVLHGR